MDILCDTTYSNIPCLVFYPKLYPLLYYSNAVFLNGFPILFTDAQKSSYKCPEKDGQYEDPIQCDKFYECVDGVATEKLCPDGLVFDPLNRKINKCDQPFNVDCGDRIELREFEDPSLFLGTLVKIEKIL